MSRIISFSEVQQHKTDKSCWIVIHNNVYDVTSYLSEHPGGEDALLERAGQDGTQDFEDVGHSDDAREIMKKFKIGTLSPDDIIKTDTDNTADRPGFEGTALTIFSRPKPEQKTGYKTPPTPVIERRVKSITVPKERARLKWAVLALAGAVVVGLVLKKYLAT